MTPLGSTRAGIRGLNHDTGLPIGLPDIKHRWVLDEGQGETWRDAEGSADATANFTNWVEGNYIGDYKVNLSGSSDKADTPATLSPGDKYLFATVEIPSQRSAFEDILGFQHSDSVADFGLQFTSGGEAQTFYYDDAADYYGVRGSTLNAGIYRLVGYYDDSASELGLAVNGSVVATTSASGNFTTDATNHGIGYAPYEGDGHFGGSIADCGMGTTAPTASEIQADYDSMPWS